MDIEAVVIRFGERQRYMLRLRSGILICAAICAILSGLHRVSAMDLAEVSVPRHSESINEIYCSPGIESEFRTIDNLVNLLFRERMVVDEFLSGKSVWINYFFYQAVLWGNRINCNPRGGGTI